MSETPGGIIRAFVAGIETRDMANAVPFLADDVVFDNVPQEMPSKITNGPAAVGKRLQMLLDMCEKVEWEILSQVEEGDRVFNERVDRFWFRPGTFPKRDLLEWPTATRFDLRGGRIVLWRDYYNLREAEPQLGVDLAEFGRIIGRGYGRD